MAAPRKGAVEGADGVIGLGCISAKASALDMVKAGE